MFDHIAKKFAKKQGINPLAAGVVGAVAGAAAVGAATALSNEETRKKLEDTVISLKNQAVTAFHDLKSTYMSGTGTEQKNQITGAAGNKKNKSIFS